MRPRAIAQASLDAIRRHRLWEPGDRVLVAVSGGRDSVVLLDLLCETAGVHGARLELGTVDHGTRAGSAGDADFAAALGAARGLPVHRFALGLGAGASEATCREARYAALRSVGAARVAVAHHRADQAETVLLRLLRGTGPAGLAAMRPRAGDLVRPLLGLDPGDLAAWAASRGLGWREDPSNGDPRHLRNRVRAELLPLLEALRAGAVAALCRTAALCAEQADALDAAAPPLRDPLDVGALREASPAVARREVLRALPGLEHRHVDHLLELARGTRRAVTLPGGRRAVVSAGRVRTSPLPAASTSTADPLLAPLSRSAGAEVEVSPPPLPGAAVDAKPHS